MDTISQRNSPVQSQLLTLSGPRSLKIVGLVSVPSTVNVVIHMIGLPLFFFGVVFLQAIIGVQDWKL